MYNSKCCICACHQVCNIENCTNHESNDDVRCMQIAANFGFIRLNMLIRANQSFHLLGVLSRCKHVYMQFYRRLRLCLTHSKILASDLWFHAVSKIYYVASVPRKSKTSREDQVSQLLNGWRCWERAKIGAKTELSFGPCT